MVTLASRRPAKGMVMTERFDNLQDRNISAVFNILDSNRSGSITAEDFDLIGRRVCEQLGVAVDSDNGRKVCECYKTWWNQLREDLDVDNDGQVTMAEFAAVYKGDRGDPQEYFSKHIGPAARVVAEMLDTDNDGYISQDDYLALMASITDQQAALAGFRQLDTDGDGRVSVAELQAGIQQVMLSNDPSAPGTSMLVEH
ncbi:MAG TPA: EF-hand domain-containing protein [Pseudonocardiaceae bacterium]|nr:EF-hand domain-containing protein [Pseudonocardiaceae bacterium]